MQPFCTKYRNIEGDQRSQSITWPTTVV
jgi:hypothetical protein